MEMKIFFIAGLEIGVLTPQEGTDMSILLENGRVSYKILLLSFTCDHGAESKTIINKMCFICLQIKLC